MRSEEARQKLFELFGNQLFISKDFDIHFYKLKESMQSDFLAWCKECKEGQAKVQLR
jgi:hypothetical protein